MIDKYLYKLFEWIDVYCAKLATGIERLYNDKRKKKK